MVMTEEEVNKEIYANLKYRLAPDEQDRAFDSTIRGLNKAYFEKAQSAKVVPLKMYLKWATGIAAVMLIGLFIWAPWNSSLYEDYAISKNLSVTERGQAGADVLRQAAEQYNHKNYAAAKALFAEAHAATPEDAMVGYYYAITLVETAEEDKGRKILEGLFEGASVFKYDAAFYMALSYVKQDKKTDALEWLDKIPTGTSHYDAAQELMRKLK